GDIVVVMDLADEIGILQQQLRGPERIAQFGPAAFKFRREGAVEHDDLVFFKKWGEGIHHEKYAQESRRASWGLKLTTHHGGDVGRISSYSVRSSVSL